MAHSPRKVLARIAAGIAVALLAMVALVASLVAHAELAVAHRAAEHAFEWTGSQASRGTVRIGRVASLPPGRMSLRDYRIVAPDGETVIATDEIAGMFDPAGLLEGEIRFRPSWFVRSRIRLTEGPGGQINLVYASEVPDERFTIPLVFDDIRLIDNTIELDLPGKPGLTMRNVNGLADLHIGHTWRWRLDGNSGEVDLRPFVHPGFREMNGRVTSDHGHPLVVRLVLDLEIVEPGLALDYYVPALAGEEGEPYFDLDIGEDVHESGVDRTEEQEEAAEQELAMEALDEADRAAAREVLSEIARRREQRADALEGDSER